MSFLSQEPDTGRKRSFLDIRPGDGSLSGILGADFLGALAGSLVHITMVWWVLSQDAPDRVVALMMLAIFVPLNVGVLLSGYAVSQFGSRKLLLFSKLISMGGALACFVLLATGAMTLWLLAVVAFITYGAMGPSVAADIARVPALVRLAERRLASFHAVNSVAMVLGQIAGLSLAGFLALKFEAYWVVLLGVACLGASTFVTWASFPRDRMANIQNSSPVEQIKESTKAVLKKLNGRAIRIQDILATAAIIATAEGCVEVILPLAFRASEFSSSALSSAYVLAVVAGVLGAMIAQAVHGKFRLIPMLMFIGVLLVVILSAASVLNNTAGVIAGVAATSAAAWAGGTLTVSTLQEEMPVSLQAQAISLWHTLVLTTGALTILIAGQIGWFSMPFITLLAVAAVILCVNRLLSKS